jgi:hypothetical protein
MIGLDELFIKRAEFLLRPYLPRFEEIDEEVFSARLAIL